MFVGAKQPPWPPPNRACERNEINVCAYSPCNALGVRNVKCFLYNVQLMLLSLLLLLLLLLLLSNRVQSYAKGALHKSPRSTVRANGANERELHT